MSSLQLLFHWVYLTINPYSCAKAQPTNWKRRCLSNMNTSVLDCQGQTSPRPVCGLSCKPSILVSLGLNSSLKSLHEWSRVRTDKGHGVTQPPERFKKRRRADWHRSDRGKDGVMLKHAWHPWTAKVKASINLHAASYCMAFMEWKQYSLIRNTVHLTNMFSKMCSFLLFLD